MKSAKRLNFLAISEQAGWGDSLKRALSASSYKVQIESIDAFIPIHRYLLRSLPHAILLSAELNESVVVQVAETVDRISAGLPVCMVGKLEGTSSRGLPLYTHPEKGEPDAWISRIMSSGNGTLWLRYGPVNFTSPSCCKTSSTVDNNDH